MMAKSSIRCLYKRYHLLKISLDIRVPALSESRRLVLRSLSLRSMASTVSEPSLNWKYGMCNAHSWRAERANLVVHLAAIYIYTSGKIISMK